MKNTIKKVLKENRQDRFKTIFLSKLKVENDKRALDLGIDDSDWYLGSQIYYKWFWLQQPNGHCIFHGSPDIEVAKETALFDEENCDMKEPGCKLYCNLLFEYYNLGDFVIPKDDKSIFAFLDRYVTLVDLNDSDLNDFMEDPYSEIENYGFEFVDFDIEDEIGDNFLGMTHTITNIFKTTFKLTKEIIFEWVKNKLLTGNYSSV